MSVDLTPEQVVHQLLVFDARLQSAEDKAPKKKVHDHIFMRVTGDQITFVNKKWLKGFQARQMGVKSLNTGDIVTKLGILENACKNYTLDDLNNALNTIKTSNDPRYKECQEILNKPGEVEITQKIEHLKSGINNIITHIDTKRAKKQKKAQQIINRTFTFALKATEPTQATTLAQQPPSQVSPPQKEAEERKVEEVHAKGDEVPVQQEAVSEERKAAVEDRGTPVSERKQEELIKGAEVTILSGPKRPQGPKRKRPEYPKEVVKKQKLTQIEQDEIKARSKKLSPEQMQALGGGPFVLPSVDQRKGVLRPTTPQPEKPMQPRVAAGKPRPTTPQPQRSRQQVSVSPQMKKPTLPLEVLREQLKEWKTEGCGLLEQEFEQELYNKFAERIESTLLTKETDVEKLKTLLTDKIPQLLIQFTEVRGAILKAFEEKQKMKGFSGVKDECTDLLNGCRNKITTIKEEEEIEEYINKYRRGLEEIQAKCEKLTVPEEEEEAVSEGMPLGEISAPTPEATSSQSVVARFFAKEFGVLFPQHELSGTDVKKALLKHFQVPENQQKLNEKIQEMEQNVPKGIPSVRPATEEGIEGLLAKAIQLHSLLTIERSEIEQKHAEEVKKALGFCNFVDQIKKEIIKSVGDSLKADNFTKLEREFTEQQELAEQQLSLDTLLKILDPTIQKKRVGIFGVLKNIAWTEITRATRATPSTTKTLRIGTHTMYASLEKRFSAYLPPE